MTKSLLHEKKVTHLCHLLRLLHFGIKFENKSCMLTGCSAFIDIINQLCLIFHILSVNWFVFIFEYFTWSRIFRHLWPQRNVFILILYLDGLIKIVMYSQKLLGYRHSKHSNKVGNLKKKSFLLFIFSLPTYISII